MFCLVHSDEDYDIVSEIDGQEKCSIGKLQK